MARDQVLAGEESGPVLVAGHPVAKAQPGFRGGVVGSGDSGERGQHGSRQRATEQATT
ncbi:MAG TPA: hypothetical protein VJT49_28305 [Amycolatopsis sp.]|uniref:hypothetical protein n=1 Tax=Amycolatopsis sp. TaxID=37632 RepID=UPI002B46EBED|nr:hypothetical protein [Amycolatopsis sp.]HKS48941.1 hypothetical protein [Amycolatopsis sp.]